MRTKVSCALFFLALARHPLSAQATPSAAPSADEQMTQAVLPLPAEMRAHASVLGYSPEGKLTLLRNGNGSMTCLANDPRSARFHVACYHKSLEPFMARGRALRAQGVKGDMVDSVRFREAREGKLKLPDAPALLYALTGEKDAYDPATKSARARALFVVYMPYATSETTGLSAVPAQGTPWVMFPGTPKAHIMFVPKM